MTASRKSLWAASAPAPTRVVRAVAFCCIAATVSLWFWDRIRTDQPSGLWTAVLASICAYLALEIGGLRKSPPAQNPDDSHAGNRGQKNATTPFNRKEDLQLIATLTPSAMALSDPQARITWINSALENATGYGFDEVKGQVLSDLLCGPNTDPKALEDIRESIRSGNSFSTELLLYKKNHKEHWARLDGSRIGAELSPSSHGFIWTLTNLSARKKAEEELQRTQERFRLALAGSKDAIWDWDLTTGHIHFSERWKELLDCVEQNVRPEPEEWFRRITPRDLPRFKSALEDHISGRTDHLEFEMEMRRTDGDSRLVLCRAAAIRDENHRATRIAGSLADITELKIAEADLRRAALHDRLTGLCNRALLVDRIEQSLARANREPDYGFAILFFDFDHFKVVNDSLGHRVGDALLVRIARRLRQEIRQNDTAARLGGDEFVVLIDDTHGLNDAQEKAKSFLEILARPHSIEGKEVVSTASIGLVSSEMGYRSADDMLRDADSALYQAKANGRAQFCVFDAKMHRSAIERLRTESELRLACEAQQFTLVYQPVVDLRSGQVDGFEALVRWEHPTRGRLAPDQFIGIAEETGLIVALGDWVLQEAARQLQEWRRERPSDRPVTVNVNLSRRQIGAPKLLSNLRSLIQHYAIEPGTLKLEITETTVMDERSNAVPILEKIQALGIPIAMDDFGTGHSSLAFLHRFPIDILKIDKSFIRELDRKPEPTAMIGAILTLARDLSIDVVAEGIETEAQLAQLHRMGCDYGQGYLFAKPLEAKEVIPFMNGSRDWKAA